ncbi:hypothetical protein ABN028_31000 [Actinopolymorpha sp. B17G11]|uniref:hypothetical protein n=1 Tax=Actinopolymorpha sp. B17G11 TaxID=3160861 RepID=UPI0032E4AE97
MTAVTLKVMPSSSTIPVAVYLDLPRRKQSVFPGNCSDGESSIFPAVEPSRLGGMARRIRQESARVSEM